MDKLFYTGTNISEAVSPCCEELIEAKTDDTKYYCSKCHKHLRSAVVKYKETWLSKLIKKLCQ